MNATGGGRACAGIVLLALLATTGCQSDPRPATLGWPATMAHLPAGEIKAMMLKDMRAEPHVTWHGRFREEGTEFQLWTRMDREGNCHLRVRVDTGPMELKVVDGKAYIRMSAKALRAQVGDGETADAIVDKARGKWIRAGRASEDDVEYCDRRQVLDRIEKDLDDDLEVGEFDHFAIGETLQLRSPGEFVYVSTKVPHLIAQIVDSDSNVLKFDYDAFEPIRKPGKDKLVVIPGLSPDALPV
ncbi:hypothetical protein [Nocardioides speluncae]|uniref:hypothetical protein n=1 Tax=Nocardioides speluncae TaxID=2670337 RepID=UPI0012B17FA4|nr:hypothetical protein [Nocardioides speluncae]